MNKQERLSKVVKYFMSSATRRWAGRINSFLIGTSLQFFKKSLTFNFPKYTHISDISVDLPFGGIHRTKLAICKGQFICE